MWTQVAINRSRIVEGPGRLVFSSIIFIFYFLPVTLGLYYLTGARNGTLLAASVLFYTWGEGAYLILLATSIALNYALGHWIAAQEGKWRTVLLLLAVAINLGVLGYFKYGDFVYANIRSLLSLPPHEFQTHLPLGISFFTFQIVSYLVDVSRRAVSPDRSIVRFGTYILMFPHLIAGPIVRYASIADELKSRSVDFAKFGFGLQYFIVGLSQKVLIANTLAGPANEAFNLDPTLLTAPTAWLGMVCYTLQIFFDFCGYSNMAIGLAFMLGFRFPKNFDFPYAAQSLTEFWRRWHISLSSWFRDYVYIPLGGNRHGSGRTLFNLLMVFALTGLWHGAEWTFVLWGLYHGAFLLIERLGFGRVLSLAPSAIRVSYTVLAVMIGWVLFRAESLPTAISYIQVLFVGDWHWHRPPWTWLTTEVYGALIVGTLLSFPVVPAFLDRLGVERFGRDAHIKEARLDPYYVHPLPVAMLVLGFVLSVGLLVGSTLNPFLYFRF